MLIICWSSLVVAGGSWWMLMMVCTVMFAKVLMQMHDVVVALDSVVYEDECDE